jgi:hypothetical protein
MGIDFFSGLLIWTVVSQTGVHKDILSNYVEIDFPEVTGKKVMSIRKSKELSAVLGNPSDIHVCEHLQWIRVDNASSRLLQLKVELLCMHRLIISCLPTCASHRLQRLTSFWPLNQYCLPLSRHFFYLNACSCTCLRLIPLLCFSGLPAIFRMPGTKPRWEGLYTRCLD